VRDLAGRAARLGDDVLRKLFVDNAKLLLPD
jgi:hypothetical protein